MRIHKAMKDAEHPYAMVSKGWVNDPNLSWKAKGLMTYLISKPDTWSVQSRDLVRKGRDGRVSVHGALMELENNGYIKRTGGRDKNGRYLHYVYEVYEEPIHCMKPATVNVHVSK